MNKGSSSDECIPKFFKVYLPDDSGDNLELPISFNRYLPKHLPKTVTVRSTCGNIWTMVFKKCCGDVEKFVMINGWKRIVKEEDLKGGEFLAFEFDGFRLFNFCIYGHATCKKLRISVQTKEIQDLSDGENGKSSDDIIVLDDHVSDEDKSSANIIVLDDDTDVQDDNEEDTSSEDITVLDDVVVEEDIIYIDDDDENDYADDGNEIRTVVETEGTEKGSSGILKKSGSEDDRQYLDDDMNPFFRVNLINLHRDGYLHVPSKVINNYSLHFPDFINLIDPLDKRFGKVERRFMYQRIMRFDSIIRRNKVKSTDKVICELKTDTSRLVREIKVHVIRG